VGNVTKFQAAHSQTASLAIAGTAVAALTAGGRKVGANITAMCEMCCIPWYTSISGRIVWEMMNLWTYIREHGFLDPDLREAGFAVICPLHSMLGTYALQKSGPETDLGATNCNRRY